MRHQQLELEVGDQFVVDGFRVSVLQVDGGEVCLEIEDTNGHTEVRVLQSPQMEAALA